MLYTFRKNQASSTVRTSLVAHARQSSYILKHGVTTYQVVQVPVNLTDMDLPYVEIYQLYQEATGSLSYLVITDRQAVVVDPSLDSEIYIKLAWHHKARIVGVFDTHFHPNDDSGGQHLSDQIDGVYIAPGQKTHRGVQTNIQPPLTMALNKLIIRIIATPGHTTESATYLVTNVAFTGDTVFMGGIGNLEASANIRELAAMFWETLYNRLLKLPDDTLILPAHDRKDQELLSDGPITTTVKALKKKLVGSPLASQSIFVERMVNQASKVPQIGG